MTFSTLSRYALAVLAAVSIAGGPTMVHAETTLSATGEFSSSATLASDYRFRGISQTFRDPAIQGSVEFAMANKFYLGSFASIVDKVQYENSRGFEIDLYGGYRTTVAKDFLLDVGLIQYLYPTSSEYSTLEAYAGVSWMWLSFKINQSLSNKFFGTPNARDSQYFDLTAAYPLRNGLKLIGHYGVQRVANNDGGYTDYRVGVEKAWKGFTWGASVIGTDVDAEVRSANGRAVRLGERGVVLSVSKNF